MEGPKKPEQHVSSFEFRSGCHQGTERQRELEGWVRAYEGRSQVPYGGERI